MAAAGLVGQRDGSDADLLPLGSTEFARALQKISERIEAVLESERQILGRSSFDELEQVIARKDQLVLEIARLGRHVIGGILDQDGRALLDQAARSIGANAKLLKVHIDAVGEIAGLITEICASADADGTYTTSVARRRNAT